MLSNIERRWLPLIINPLARLMEQTGISPNALTWVGFFLAVGVAYVLAQGYLLWGGVWVLIAGAFDALDGTLARQTGRTTAFGAFLDSTLDRFSEAVILLGLLIYALGLEQGDLEIILIFVAVVGSLLVSYTRSRAGELDVKISQGFFGRTERVVLLGVGLIINQLTITLWILALFSNLTAGQRMWLVWQKIGKANADI